MSADADRFDESLGAFLRALAPVLALSEPVKLYDHKGIVLYQGDCRFVLARLENRSIDHIITDPQYEAEAHTKGRRTKNSYGSVISAPLSFDAMTDDLRAFIGVHASRLVRRWALVFCQVEAAMIWRDALEDELALEIGAEDPLRYMRTMVWIKPDAQPQLTGDRPGMGYESIVVAHAAGKSRWNGRGRDGIFSYNRERGPDRVHETQKPIGLMRELVHLFTDEGDLVLDPFAGSATTLVACRTLNRRAIGVELDPVMAEKARRRLEEMDRQGSMFAAGSVSITKGANDVDDSAGHEERSGRAHGEAHASSGDTESIGSDLAGAKDRDSSDSGVDRGPVADVVEPRGGIDAGILAASIVSAVHKRAENLAESPALAHKADMLGAFHRCDALDGRPLLYLPALDPSATDIAGGAKVSARFVASSVPPFDYDAKRDGPCWICAYADGLRTGRLSESAELAEKVDAPRVSLRDRLRAFGIVTRDALAEVASHRAAVAASERVHIAPEPKIDPRTELRSTGNAIADDIGFHSYERTEKSAPAHSPEPSAKESAPETNKPDLRVVPPARPPNKQQRMF